MKLLPNRGFLGAVALGVGIGPYIVNRPATAGDRPAAGYTSLPFSLPEAPETASAPRRSTTPTVPAIAPSAPELHARVKPLLNKGADMTLASKDFKSAEQFAAVAHAARNTEIPFVLLRHRVLNEKKNLATAIRESRPDINATIEANRAVAEAKSDLAALEG